ncbi:UNVERIFIED_CONTAM: hypothetical protein HDU68_010160, partial [Siphonaria sp. JEL0065]
YRIVRSPKELSSIVLTELLNEYKRQHGVSVAQVVVTVPVIFTYVQCMQIADIARICGMQYVSLLNEPTAAALNYFHCHHQKNFNHPMTILIADIGGGTLDLSILEASRKSELAVLNMVGNHALGGNDFTNELYWWAVDQIGVQGYDSDAFAENEWSGVKKKHGNPKQRQCEKEERAAAATSSFSASGSATGDDNMGVSKTKKKKLNPQQRQRLKEAEGGQ